MRRRGPLEKYRVHFPAQQPDQFACLTAASPPAENLGACDALGRSVALARGDDMVHQLHIGDLESLQAQRVLQTANGLSAREVDLHVLPFRQAEATTLQILG